MKNEKLKILVIGPQGSGKTTQAKLLADFLGVPLISTGEILRQKAKVQDELGQKIREFLDKGELVDDEIVHQIVIEQLEDEKSKNGFVMDGYPRSLTQIEHLDPKFDVVFYLEISDNQVMERLLKRGRTDDMLELIKERLNLYHQLTEPLLVQYKSRGILHIIDGSGSIDKIQQEIVKALNG